MSASTTFSARSTDLVVQEHGDELLVYDQRSEVAHCLSAVAATVWRHCDGDTTLAGLSEAVASVQPDGDAEQLTLRALEELDGKGLLENRSGPAGVSRRQIVQRVAAAGVAAAAAPLVVSATIATPQAAAYGTTGIHVACNNTSQCAAGLTCQNGYCYTAGQTCTAGNATPTSGTCPKDGTNPTCCSGNCQGASGKCAA